MKRKTTSKRRKSNGKFLAEMSRKEKKHFLSMDLVERMIRIEQRVSASFNKKIPYRKTQYYKSISAEEQNEFEQYLNKNKRRGFILAALLSVSLLVLIFLRADVTGNAVRTITGNSSLINLLENASALAVLIVCALILILFISKIRRAKMYEKNFKILEDIFLEKGMVKHRK